MLHKHSIDHSAFVTLFLVIAAGQMLKIPPSSNKKSLGTSLKAGLYPRWGLWLDEFIRWLIPPGLYKRVQLRITAKENSGRPDSHINAILCVIAGSSSIYVLGFRAFHEPTAFSCI